MRQAVPAAGLGQTQVAAFNTVDLYAQYDLKQTSFLPLPISLSLGITNVFANNPPVYYAAGNLGGQITNGYANGSTIGRVFYLDANVKL